MDELLINMAVEAGVVFCAETAAKVVDDAALRFRNVQLAAPDSTTCTIRAPPSCCRRRAGALVTKGHFLL